MRYRDRGQTRYDWSLWRRWVLANAAGEVVDLGGTAALGAALGVGRVGGAGGATLAAKGP